MLIYTIVGIALVLAVILGLRAVLGSRPLDAEARQDFRFREAEGLNDGKLTEDQYAKAYRRFHGPRGAAYASVTLFGIALLTAPLLGILSLLFEYGWRLGGQQREFEPGYLVWQFMLFMGMIAGWAILGWIGARFYHRSAPVSLQAEMIRARSD